METYIPISFLNDFIFCPRSIYYHILYGKYEEMMYQSNYQTEGKNAHKQIDIKSYSDRKSILQNFEIVSHQYGIYGNIDLFDMDKGILSERKKSIKVIYDGYVFQVYAQYFGLKEMGYEVKDIKLYDFSSNKSYPIPLPENDNIMLNKFEETVLAIKDFSLLKKGFAPNKNKCIKCIYNPLCDSSLC